MKTAKLILILTLFVSVIGYSQKHPYSGITQMKFNFLYMKGDFGDVRKQREIKTIVVSTTDGKDFSEAATIKIEIKMKPNYTIGGTGASEGPIDIEVAYEWTFTEEIAGVDFTLKLLKKPFAFKGRSIVGYLASVHPEIRETYYLEKQGGAKKNYFREFPFAKLDKPPVFNGCSGNNEALKKCFARKVQMHFLKKFDSDIPNELGMQKGVLEVKISFRIDRGGVIGSIRTNSNSEKLEQEIVRVMKLLRIPLEAGEIEGVPVNSRYTFPMTFSIQ